MGTILTIISIIVLVAVVVDVTVMRVKQYRGNLELKRMYLHWEIIEELHTKKAALIEAGASSEEIGAVTRQILEERTAEFNRRRNTR